MGVKIRNLEEDMPQRHENTKSFLKIVAIFTHHSVYFFISQKNEQNPFLKY